MSFDYALRHMLRAEAENGRVIEGAWKAFSAVCRFDDKPRKMRDNLRAAFFAGAYEMLLSLCGGVFDDGEEVSAGDERRLRLIQSELEAFFEEHSARLGFITAPERKKGADA